MRSFSGNFASFGVLGDEACLKESLASCSRAASIVWYQSFNTILLAAVFCGFLQGCAYNTSQQIRSDGVIAETTTSSPRRYLGFVSLFPTTSAESQVDIERARGFGMRMAGGFSFGYFDDWVAHVKPGCQVVLLIPDGASATDWKKSLQASIKESLCVISKP